MENKHKEILIVDKEGLFPKKIYYTSDRFNFEYITKVSSQNIFGEHAAFTLIVKLGLSRFFATLFSAYHANNEYFLIEEYVKNDIHTFYNKNVRKKDMHVFWYRVFRQLAWVICILEENKIQHNDFHLGNLHVEGTPTEPIIKIIDLETMVDYRTKKVYPLEVINADNDDKIRMGWNKEFHIGSDLNQMFGELMNFYEDDMPKEMVEKIKPLIIEKDKEFPYALHLENKHTTGKEMSRLIKSLKKHII